MNRTEFRKYLESRKADEATIERSFALAERFEVYARDARKTSAEKASADVAHAFAKGLIETGENTYDAFLALARLGRFLGNHAVLVAMLEVIDGHEALGNLHRKVERELGAAGRDDVFAGVEVPPLGVPNVDRARRMRVVVERLEEKIGRERTGRLIGEGLRDLPDEAFEDERLRFREAGGIDEYLRRRGDAFIEELSKIRDANGLYFSQPINDEVIAFVESHPEIRQGVRVGNVLYEAKIPYMAVEYVRETDPKKKAYLYCHCPWARESLQKSEKRVSPTFCACSAAFHRKPYEVIFGQTLESEVLETVLAGDPWCRFAIHLPEGTA
jgi:hypothetical protein